MILIFSKESNIDHDKNMKGAGDLLASDKELFAPLQNGLLRIFKNKN